jgi:hypothetical protein
MRAAAASGQLRKTRKPSQERKLNKSVKIIGSILCAATALLPSVSNAQGKHIAIANYLPYEMILVYASPAGKENWSENLLGEGWLEPGQQMTVVFDLKGECNFDLNAIVVIEERSSSGEQVNKELKQTVDLCKVSNLVYQ